MQLSRSCNSSDFEMKLGYTSIKRIYQTIEASHFSITSIDGNYIPMFSHTELFLVDFRLNKKTL